MWYQVPALDAKESSFGECGMLKDAKCDGRVYLQLCETFALYLACYCVLILFQFFNPSFVRVRVYYVDK